MQQRFVSLWARCVPDSGARRAGDVYRKLHALYQHPGRYYHDLNHIRACLRHIDAVGSRLNHPDAVEMALWFHDVIYEPGAQDNERRSAEFFTEIAVTVADVGFADEVSGLIMMTVHPSTPRTLDEKFTVDIDLASFGLPWEEFASLGELVRKEFPHSSDRDFEARQLRFFEMLTRQRYFYFTDFFRSRFEANAQANLRRRIAQLESGIT